MLDTLRFEEVSDDTVVVERSDGQWRLMPNKRLQLTRSRFVRAIFVRAERARRSWPRS